MAPTTVLETKQLPKAFPSRFGGQKCATCAKTIYKGDMIRWSRKTKGVVWHENCYETRPQTEETAPMDVEQSDVEQSVFAAPEHKSEVLINTPHVAPKSDNGLAQTLANALSQYLPNGTVDEKQVIDLIKRNTLDADEITELVKAYAPVPKTIQVEVKTAETGEVKNMGLQHHKLPLMIQTLSARQSNGYRLNVWLTGPAGCISGETELWDPIANVGKRVDELCFSGTRPIVQTLMGPMLAEVPFVKGYDDLYRVTLANGKSSLVTARHLFLTRQGWKRVCDLSPDMELLSESPEDAPRYSQTIADYRASYLPYHHSCDGLLQSEVADGQSFLPLQADVREHNRLDSRRGASASKSERNQICRLSARRSMQSLSYRQSPAPLGDRMGDYATLDAESPFSSSTAVLDALSCRPQAQSRLESLQTQPFVLPYRGVSRKPQSVRVVSSENDPSIDYRPHWVPVATIAYERTDYYFDLHVPVAEHYLADGMYSHNSGKTTAASACATALGLPYYFTGALDNPYGLLGFTDANGKTVRTPFREAYETGGVFLFDEIDACSPNAVLAFNAALANGHCAFPDGIIARHKDFVCVAAANTWGLGATNDYVGRMKQDAAFNDRFVQLNWDIDENLETETCGNPTWAKRVQSVRSKVKALGIKVVVSPRASYFGAGLLACGMSQSDVEAMTLRKAMTDEQWASVSGGR